MGRRLSGLSARQVTRNARESGSCLGKSRPTSFSHDPLDSSSNSPSASHNLEDARRGCSVCTYLDPECKLFRQFSLQQIGSANQLIGKFRMFPDMTRRENPH